ncbi:unnamed protein product [Cunninghamella echinulata]
MSKPGLLRSQTLMIGRTGSSVVSYQEEMPNVLCESCIERLFGAGPSHCPMCQLVLRKNQFMSQIFEISKFNKRPEDFPSLRTYNDYLEEVEDIRILNHANVYI